MRICYLHIGMPKTGTMSIQASLGQAASLQGARYISIDGHINCSAPLLEIYAGEVHARDRATRDTWTPEAIAAEKARLLAALRAGFDSAHELFVLSGERLHNLSAEQLTALHEELRRHVDEVRVVAYVRGAVSWIESAFQQRVKTGDPAEFNNLRKVLPDYRSKFERFDVAFGRDQVILWPFHPASMPGRDVVLDFCQRLGIPFEKSQVIIDNEGVSVDGVGLLYLYRRLGKPAQMSLRDKQDIRLLTRHLRALEGDKMTLAPAVLKPYLQTVEADMAWMEGRSGVAVSAAPTARPGAIKTEEQLMTPTPGAIAWLEAQLGHPLPAPAGAQQAAEAMNEWLQTLRARMAARRAHDTGDGRAPDQPTKPKKGPGMGKAHKGPNKDKPGGKAGGANGAKAQKKLQKAANKAAQAQKPD